MKKIFAIAAAFLCVATAVAEKRIVRSVLLSVPIDHEYVHYNDDGYTTGNGYYGVQQIGGHYYYDCLKSTGVDVEFNKLRVMDSKFSTIFGIGMGYTSSKWAGLDEESIDCKYNLFNMNLKFGLGGAFVNTEKVILALHGFLGMSGKVGKSNDEYKSLAFSGVGHVGFDLSLVVFFTESLGLSAGFDASYMIGYAGDVDWLTGMAHGFSLVPKVGVAFAF